MKRSQNNFFFVLVIMRVSVSSLAFLAVFSPIGGYASGKLSAEELQALQISKPYCFAPPKSPEGGFSRPPVANYEGASWADKIVYLSAAGHHQTALEHFYAAPADQQRDYDARKAYKKSRIEFIRFEPAPDASWDGFTDAEKVRALWQSGLYHECVRLYEASEACKQDSKATVAYFDSKMWFILWADAQQNHGGKIDF